MKLTEHFKRTYLKGSLSAIVLAVGTFSVQSSFAQEWPKASAIKFIVPFTAGSGTDIIARTLAEKLSPALGARIIIENKPGAGGTVGAAQVASSPPDGYTFLIHSSGHVVNPALFPKLSYDTLKDFDGITPLASLPNVLVVTPAKGYKDVADLVAKVKAKPDAFNYASAGNGSATHMNAEKFRLAANIKAQHIPFKGTPEAMTETIAGRIDWFFAPLVSALPLIKDGKLQALAVGTSSRAAALPNIASMADSGLPDASYTFWVGLFATAKTPRAIIEKLNMETVKILNSADMKEKLDKLGATAMPMEQAAFEKFLTDETRAAGALVKSAGIKID
jgi:tripartite-type tricarboxylate transporter receptor subunit TctC